MIVLEVENAVKRYGEKAAVDGVSFAAGGEIFGLLGANGAGKSTLLKAVVGLVELDGGAVRVRGHDTYRRPLAARAATGYLPEDLRLYERLTGGEFLDLVAGLRSLPGGGGVGEELAFFGLAEHRHRLVGEYSLGMRKKLGLAAAFLGKPPLILLDEPLNGLDTEAMHRLGRRLRRMVAEEGVTFVLSSHIMAFVERLCDRALILKEGRAAASGTPADLRRAAGLPDAPFDEVFLKLAL